MRTPTEAKSAELGHGRTCPFRAKRRASKDDSAATSEGCGAYNRLEPGGFMQLQLSREEQALLADVLQDISVSAGRKIARDRILGHLCEHDLSFAYDELEDLSDFLAEISRR